MDKLSYKSLLSLIAVFASALFFVGCSDDDAFENAAEKTGDAIENAAEGTEEAAEDAADKVKDAGEKAADSVKDATN